MLFINYFVLFFFPQYDIRIWHEVHSAAIKQARSDAKKERMKRRLYDDPMHNKEVGDDDEMSLDKIKRRVLLKRIINRRYREFMELHNRLTNGPLSVHMKGIMKIQIFRYSCHVSTRAEVWKKKKSNNN